MTTEPTSVPIQPTEPPAAAPAPVAPARSRMGAGAWLNIGLGLALAVAVGGVAFAAGRMTAPASARDRAGTEFGRPSHDRMQGQDHRGGQYLDGQYLGGGQVPGGQYPGAQLPGAGQPGLHTAIQGTVTAISADAITITTAGGQTVQIALTGGTTYHLESSASSGDMHTGASVIVRLTLPGAGETGPSAGDITILP